MKINREKILSMALASCLAAAQAVCLTGCGERQAQAVTEEAVIELIEPTAELSGSEAVTRRDLFTARVYEVLVDPYVEDYSYEETRNFLGTEWKMGDTVGAGNILYRANILSLDPRIEKLTEKLEELEESYAEYHYDIQTKLNDQYWELSVLDWELEEVLDQEPDDESSAAYAAWEREKERAEGEYNKKDLDIRMNEMALSERKELMYLDYEYYAGQLQELLKKNELGNLCSDITGQIVYLYACDRGDQISPGTVVASVADMNQKRLVCNSIDNSTRYTIQEAYAFFNGRRYEVAYEEESSSLTSSVFLLQDPRGEVPVGTYGNLVLYTGMKEQVLTVPKEAVHNVGLEKYVYVLEGDRTALRTVRIGLTDDVYVEILSGLEEGERVFLDRSDPQAVHRAVLEKGSVSLAYSEKGTLYYPIEFDVSCDVDHGTVVFKSWQPYENVVKGQTYAFDQLADAWYMPMKAGDIIANISVVPSDVEKQEMIQLENDLRRAEERLEDLMKEEESESRDKLIESRQADIERKREELVDLITDYSITSVRAERNGLLYAVNDRIYYQGGGSRVGISVLTGDKMDRDYVYARMVDNSIAYLLLPEKAAGVYGRFGYNTTMTVSYNNWENEIVTREVPVATVNVGSSSQALLLDRELLEDLNIYRTQYQSTSNRQTSLEVRGRVKSMENVVLLPEKAIKLVNSSFGYVNVLEEDGSIHSVSVVIGRKYLDEDGQYNYYVIDGLTEGMTICWE